MSRWEDEVRVLALDVGEQRIGVAVSDPSQTLARSLKVLERRSLQDDIAAIRRLVEELQVVQIIVGHPRSMDGTVGGQARLVEGFVRELEQALQVPILLWDERLSTVTAARLLSERGVSARKQRGRIDSVAAAVILQDYLDSQA
ncbi:MAG TPA: Holliday junction resolvase RuvX [Anaerolineae bacterium]|nr:Holliday junction resolvase RuvX [Anaerolineae bacterium]